MVGFSYVGFLIFTITSIIMIFYIIEVDKNWVIMMLFTLCVVTTILFLIDLLLYFRFVFIKFENFTRIWFKNRLLINAFFSFWREQYMRNKKCYPQFTEEHQHPETDILYLSNKLNKKEFKVSLGTRNW